MLKRSNLIFRFGLIMKFIKHVQGAIFVFAMSLFALTVLYGRAVSMPDSAKYDWWVMLGGFFILSITYSTASIIRDWQAFKQHDFEVPG